MSILGWFYGADKLESESAELDAKLAEQNRKALERGAITQEQYDQTSSNIARGSITDVDGQINQAFDQGWEEGKANVRATIAAPINTIFGVIPWQLYAVAGVGLFFYMGGGTYLKGMLAKGSKLR